MSLSDETLNRLRKSKVDKLLASNFKNGYIPKTKRQAFLDSHKNYLVVEGKDNRYTVELYAIPLPSDTKSRLGCS